VGLRKTPAALVAFGAAAALAIAGCSSSSSSAGGSSSTSSAPAQLTVWRMGASVPSQVARMNNVVVQFHQEFPAYAHTKVNVVWVPWTTRTTDWNDAPASAGRTPRFRPTR
jgi:ABC-type glycerol-3-phosphate transport system substrate-binding protein